MSSTLTQHSAVQSKTKEIILSGLLVALVFVATKFINIRLPFSVNGGLIHLGNTVLFMAAILFGKKKGAIAGAFGMGLFDLLSGWMLWAPFTFVIRGVMGYIIGSVAWAQDRKGESIVWNLLGIIIAGLWMISGYYITEVILYGHWLTPLTSVSGNVIQLVVGMVLGLPLSAGLKRTNIV